MKLKKWNDILLRILKLLVKRDFRVFVVCIIISSVIWVSLELSDSFTNNADLSVSYTQTANNLVLVNSADSVFKVHLESVGFELINLTLGDDKRIVIDLNRINPLKESDGFYHARIASTVFEEQIRQQLGAGIRARIISPDTIHFVFDELLTKRVRVQCKYNFKYQEGFKLLGSPKLSPDSVEIRGARSKIKNITEIQTSPLSYKNLNKSKKVTQKLILSPAVKWISNSMVESYFEILQFTEKKSEIPVFVRSSVANVKIKTFPPKVQISYILPLKYFDMVEDSMFRIEVFLDSTSFENQDKLIPKLVKKPFWVDNVIFNTEVVDYIILK